MRHGEHSISEAQDKLITQINESIRYVKSRIDMKEKDLEVIRSKATFYLDLQHKLIPPDEAKSDDHLIKLWQAFIIMIKFTADDPVPGITKA